MLLATAAGRGPRPHRARGDGRGPARRRRRRRRPPRDRRERCRAPHCTRPATPTGPASCCASSRPTRSARDAYGSALQRVQRDRFTPEHQAQRDRGRLPGRWSEWTSSSPRSRPGTRCGGATSTSSPACCDATPTCACSSSSRRPTRCTRGWAAADHGADGAFAPTTRTAYATVALWLLEPTKWLPRRVDRSVDERWARQVVRAARGLGMGDPVLWVNDPRGAMLVEATTWRSLYDVTDDWTLAERPAAETERIRAQETCCCRAATRSSSARPRSQRARAPTATSRSSPTASTPRPTPSRTRVPTTCPTDPSCCMPAPSTVTASTSSSALASRRRSTGRAHLVLLGPDALAAAEQRRARGRRCRAPRRATERRGAGLPPARRRARRAARRDALHRQPRPDQALRVPGGGPAGRLDAGGRVPRRRRRPRDGRRGRHLRCRGRRASLDGAAGGWADRCGGRSPSGWRASTGHAGSTRWPRSSRGCSAGGPA